MITILQPIEQQLRNIYKEAEQRLMKVFPNLYFYISPSGVLTCWVRSSEGGSGAGIKMKHTIYIGSMLHHHWEYLADLNELVKPVYVQPDKYFYCTECGAVKSKEEFTDLVFAGYYCKECAKKPEIAALIAESYKRGFYD